MTVRVEFANHGGSFAVRRLSAAAERPGVTWGWHGF